MKFKFMKKKLFYFLLVLTIPVIVYVVHFGDAQTSNSQFEQKNERADLENTHKVITDEEELQEIAEKDNLRRTPIRIEHEYNGPKE